MLLLATAASQVNTRNVVYGPLWKWRCSTGFKTAPRMELQAYDVFCMVFLDRPGAYYRLDQLARTTRGRITPELIIAQLRMYHHLLHGGVEQREGPEVYLTNTEIKDWWTMPRHVRTSLDLRLASEPLSLPYDYGYVPFLSRFISKRLDRDGEYRFFNSLARYLPLLLSADVELRRSPALSSSSFTYGIFASRALQSGNYTQPLQPLLGEVVGITEVEHTALTLAGADFSVLVFDEAEVSCMRIPGGKKGRKQQWARQGGQSCVVAGGLAFINHACRQHANIWPAVWVDDEDVGSAQWQLATAKRDVRTDEELFLCYAKYDTVESEENEWPCTVCAHQRQGM
jgi:hypothetical protein